MILSIIKWLAWTAAILGIALAIVYGFYLILVFMLFDETLLLALTVAGEIVLWGGWWMLVRLAE